jgi:hypothetical protein
MGARYPNPQRVKVHRTYTVDELACLTDMHVNTVRAWQKTGLDALDDSRPTLFKGDVVKAFLERRKAASKQPCGPGKIFCLACRAPQRPALGMVDYVPTTCTMGALKGLCPTCERVIIQRTSRSRLADTAGSLDVRIVENRSTADSASTAQATPEGILTTPREL